MNEDVSRRPWDVEVSCLQSRAGCPGIGGSLGGLDETLKASACTWCSCSELLQAVVLRVALKYLHALQAGAGLVLILLGQGLSRALCPRPWERSSPPGHLFHLHIGADFSSGRQEDCKNHDQKLRWEEL